MEETYSNEDQELINKMIDDLRLEAKQWDWKGKYEIITCQMLANCIDVCKSFINSAQAVGMEEEHKIFFSKYKEMLDCYYCAMAASSIDKVMNIYMASADIGGKEKPSKEDVQYMLDHFADGLLMLSDCTPEQIFTIFPPMKNNQHSTPKDGFEYIKMTEDREFMTKAIGKENIIKFLRRYRLNVFLLSYITLIDRQCEDEVKHSFKGRLLNFKNKVTKLVH